MFAGLDNYLVCRTAHTHNGTVSEPVGTTRMNYGSARGALQVICRLSRLIYAAGNVQQAL